MVNLRWSLAQLSGLLENSWKAHNGLHILLLPNPWPLTLYQRQKCVFAEAGLNQHFGRGWSVYLKGMGGGSVLVAVVGGGRPILLFLLSPTSENQGIRYRWHPCSFSMIRVEDPGFSFMLCLGPGPPPLLCMTRANLKSPYAGGTPTIYEKVQNFKIGAKNSWCTFKAYSRTNYTCHQKPNPSRKTATLMVLTTCTSSFFLCFLLISRYGAFL